MFSRISFIAKPIPVDKPPETTTIQVLLTWKILSTVINHMPQMNTWITFLAMMFFEAAPVRSLVEKWYCSRANVVLLIYLKMKYSVSTTARLNRDILRLAESMKLTLNTRQAVSLKLKISVAQ